MELNTIIHGDCLEVMKKLPDNSVDSIITDPPAGIGFMGKEWDSNKGGKDVWIRWLSIVMTESLRVLKPGGHALVWALPRTSHWTATALEDAGFEIRDCVYHLFGSGFPKSLNIGKAIDKLQRNKKQYEYEGFGTALKPAVECWWLCRKPLSEKTIAENVLKYGTGGLNIDGSRVKYVSAYEEKHQGDIARGQDNATNGRYFGGKGKSIASTHAPKGRFPANLTHDGSDVVLAGFPNSKAGVNKLEKGTGGIFNKGTNLPIGYEYGDEGSAARFFYCPKPSSAEKNLMVGEFEESAVGDGPPIAIDNPFQRGKTLRTNTHPTVKSIILMTYLIKLITPPKGIVLDPFAGSGSTLIAAKTLRYPYIGIEKEKEYCDIAEARIKAVSNSLF